jgi:DNA-binding NarL/FixJ family response regulator
MMTAKIRLFVCDDHTLFRQGVKAIFHNDPTIEVVGEAGNGKEAIRKIKPLRPDVVLMDISMPEMNGFEATQRIVQSSKDIKVLILTMYDEDDLIIRCLEAGASGYVLKDAPFAQLLRAVHDAFNGGIYLSPNIVNKKAVREYLQKSKRTKDHYDRSGRKVA